MKKSRIFRNISNILIITLTANFKISADLLILILLMESSITAQLKREANLFIHQKCETLCVKEYKESFMALGKKVGPFKLGYPYRLDNYIARILVENGILKFENHSRLDNSAIQKINFQESTAPELRKIQDNVYIQALEQLKILNSLPEKDIIGRRGVRQLFSDLNDLVRVRLPKINRLAIQKPTMASKKLLTAEERVLFDYLTANIQEWRTFLESYQNGNGKKSH